MLDLMFHIKFDYYYKTDLVSTLGNPSCNPVALTILICFSGYEVL